MIPVLVKRMLPAALSDDPKQNQFAWMHVRIAVVRLVRILDRIISVHVIGHGAAVDHEVRGMVGLRDYVHAAGSNAGRARLRGLFFGLTMDLRIDLSELEQILAVVTAACQIVRGTVGAQPIVVLSIGAFRALSWRSDNSGSSHSTNWAAR